MYINPFWMGMFIGFILGAMTIIVLALIFSKSDKK